MRPEQPALARKLKARFTRASGFRRYGKRRGTSLSERRYATPPPCVEALSLRVRGSGASPGSGSRWAPPLAAARPHPAVVARRVQSQGEPFEGIWNWTHLLDVHLSSAYCVAAHSAVVGNGSREVTWAQAPAPLGCRSSPSDFLSECVPFFIKWGKAEDCVR